MPSFKNNRACSIITANASTWANVIIDRSMEVESNDWGGGGDHASYTNIVEQLNTAIDMMADRSGVRDWDPTNSAMLAPIYAKVLKINDVMYNQTLVQNFLQPYIVANGAVNTAFWPYSDYIDVLNYIDKLNIPQHPGLLALIKVWESPYQISSEYGPLALPGARLFPTMPKEACINGGNDIYGIIASLLDDLEGFVHAAKVGLSHQFTKMKSSDFLPVIRPGIIGDNMYTFTRWATPITAKDDAGAADDCTKNTGIFSQNAAPNPIPVWHGMACPNIWASWPLYDNYHANNVYGLFLPCTITANNRVSVKRTGITGTAFTELQIDEAVRVVPAILGYEWNLDGQGFNAAATLDVGDAICAIEGGSVNYPYTSSAPGMGTGWDEATYRNSLTLQLMLQLITGSGVNAPNRSYNKRG